MSSPTTGLVPAIVATARHAAKITAPNQCNTHVAPMTEPAARVVLGRIGVGGGLKSQRVDNGWLFAPYDVRTAAGRPGGSWLVTHDGTAHDLSAADSTQVGR